MLERKGEYEAESRGLDRPTLVTFTPVTEMRSFAF